MHATAKHNTESKGARKGKGRRKKKKRVVHLAKQSKNWVSAVGKRQKPSSSSGNAE